MRVDVSQQRGDDEELPLAGIEALEDLLAEIAGEGIADARLALRRALRSPRLKEHPGDPSAGRVDDARRVHVLQSAEGEGHFDLFGVECELALVEPGDVVKANP